MAREFAKVYMSIWGNPDFTRLTVGAQRLYMFLISQPDLSRAGTITLAFNRWQSRTADYEREALLTDLAELARARFVVVDEATEELLIRSYIRNDEGWKSPNIMIAVAGASKQVMSETLRAVIAQEVARIDTAGLPVKVNEKTGRSTKDFIDMVVAQLVESLSDCVVDNSVTEWGEPFGEPFREPFSGASGNPSGNPFGNPSGNPFGKGSLTTTTTATTTATATATATTTSKNEQFDTFWQLYPRKVGKDDARKAFTVAAKKHDPVDIIAGASRYAADPNLPEKQFIPHPGKWLRGGHWQDEPLPERLVLSGRRDDRQELFEFWEQHYSDPNATNPFMIEGTAL